MNCRVRNAEERVQFVQQDILRHEREKPLYLAIIHQKQEEVSTLYLSLYDHCIQNHQTPWSYYQRGLIQFQKGEIEKSLDDVRVLIETYENEQKADQLPPKAYFDKGVVESELGLYHDAISSLSVAIERDPTHKDAYFERAVAYFEEGDFDLALQDYLTSGMKLPTQKPDYLDYGQGFISGIKRGIQEELGESLPLAAPILNAGIWALANNPSPHAKLITASMACIAVAGLYLTTDQMVTELRELVANWDHLSSHQQGELCGYLIGKYGIDIFAVTGSAKMMEAYRNLKRANSLFTFEYVLKSPSEVEALKTRYKGIEKYRQDKKYTLEALEKRSSITDQFSNLIEINIEALLKAGQAIDRAGFTKAGRALMKHGYREGSVFPKPVGNPTQINELGKKS